MRASYSTTWVVSGLERATSASGATGHHGVPPSALRRAPSASRGLPFRPPPTPPGTPSSCRASRACSRCPKAAPPTRRAPQPAAALALGQRLSSGGRGGWHLGACRARAGWAATSCRTRCRRSCPLRPTRPYATRHLTPAPGACGNKAHHLSVRWRLADPWAPDCAQQQRRWRHVLLRYAHGRPAGLRPRPAQRPALQQGSSRENQHPRTCCCCCEYVSPSHPMRRSSARTRHAPQGHVANATLEERLRHWL